ncbi:flagellar biogenesis protein FliO [Actinomadura rupiterrae]|nr:flagellar biogenesis protein FliO [Actinomadura rupiterrae]
MIGELNFTHWGIALAVLVLVITFLAYLVMRLRRRYGVHKK